MKKIASLVALILFGACNPSDPLSDKSNLYLGIASLTETKYPRIERLQRALLERTTFGSRVGLETGEVVGDSFSETVAAVEEIASNVEMSQAATKIQEVEIFGITESEAANIQTSIGEGKFVEAFTETFQNKPLPNFVSEKLGEDPFSSMNRMDSRKASLFCDAGGWWFRWANPNQGSIWLGRNFWPAVYITWIFQVWYQMSGSLVFGRQCIDFEGSITIYEW
ncbi:hypothetical protein CH373_17900 [Leptospira perolatii]|uniref:Lipoprotein n=1 Tax=Leptospira perolatii TaxID=2023191 RepID=A0A2M9ZIG0_9LEPT|nr:hypothetical protein [Leptospira perolatii]PJZ68122.1 hypothetical protein CH360_17845 [Leptospira perolatii]PJZ71743.1 hypothetical protein CH373_17900 [Leptospira perolatii]